MTFITLNATHAQPIVKLVIEWAIDRLEDYPDTQTAREILRRELTTFVLECEREGI